MFARAGAICVFTIGADEDDWGRLRCRRRQRVRGRNARGWWRGYRRRRRRVRGFRNTGGRRLVRGRTRARQGDHQCRACQEHQRGIDAAHSARTHAGHGFELHRDVPFTVRCPVEPLQRVRSSRPLLRAPRRSRRGAVRGIELNTRRLDSIRPPAICDPSSVQASAESPRRRREIHDDGSPDPRDLDGSGHKRDAGDRRSRPASRSLRPRAAACRGRPARDSTPPTRPLRGLRVCYARAVPQAQPPREPSRPARA